MGKWIALVGFLSTLAFTAGFVVMGAYYVLSAGPRFVAYPLAMVCLSMLMGVLGAAIDELED